MGLILYHHWSWPDISAKVRLLPFYDVLRICTCMCVNCILFDQIVLDGFDINAHETNKYGESSKVDGCSMFYTYMCGCNNS